MKISDCVVETLRKWNSKGGKWYGDEMWWINKGDNEFFTDVWKRYEKENERRPKAYFEKWKSNVLQQLLKDKRFRFHGHSKGLKGNMISVELLKDYRI